MDELLLGYALKALSPAEAAAVERALAADPAAERKLARLRGLLEPLAAAPDPLPPPGLAVAAVGHVAAHVVEHKLLTDEPPTPIRGYASDFHPTSAEGVEIEFEDLPPAPVSVSRTVPIHRWVELATVAAIVLLAVGLGVTGLAKARHESRVAECRNRMMNLHAGLAGYADTHADQFPKVGTPGVPTAGAFVTELIAAGRLAADADAVCPGEPANGAYVYTLGYRTDGLLHGIRRHAPGVSDELTPLLADLPTPAASPTGGPVSPHGRGQNILYGDGHVRYSLLPTVGPNGDDIYCNQRGQVRAGLNVFDASLGRATDVP